MGKRGDTERLVPRWSVKGKRAQKASQGPNSQECLSLARLLEPEGSRQAHLATQGVILPGLAFRDSTDRTELPSTPPASRKFEDLFVPDSPEEVWSRGKDSSRHRGPFKLTRTRPVLISSEGFVVPDSPDESWGDGPFKLSRKPLISTNVELVVPDSPEETGASNDLSRLPCKLRRTTRVRKFHQKPGDDGNKAAWGGNSSELSFPVRAAMRSGKISFKDGADASQHFDSGIPVLATTENASSSISDRPPAMDFNMDFDHEVTELVAAPDEIRTSRVTHRLPTPLSALNFSGVNGKPIDVSLTIRSDVRSTLEDEELDNCRKSRGIVDSQEEFHRSSPTPHVPDTEEDAGAPVTPFSTTSKMLAPSSLVLEKASAFLEEESVEETEICGRAGAGFQRNLGRNVYTPIPSGDATPAPATPFPIAIGKPTLSASSSPMKKARGDKFNGSENCAEFVRARHERNLSGDVQASETGVKDTVPSSCFVTGNGKPVPLSSFAKEKKRELLRSDEVQIDGHSTSQRNPGLGNPTATFMDDAYPSKKAEIFIGDREKNDSNAGVMTLSAFSTASGRRISVSSLVMLKSRELLRDDEVETGDHSTVPGIAGHGNHVPSAKPGYEKGKAPLRHDEKENHVDFERNSLYLKLSRSSELATHRTRKLQPLSEMQAGGSILQSADKGEKVGPAEIRRSGGSCSSQFVQNEEIPDGSPSFRRRSSRRTKTISEEAIQAAKVRLARPGERIAHAFSQVAEKKIDDPDENVTFKTASGRTVAISREATEKAKALLADGTKPSASFRESIDCHLASLVTPTKIPSPAHIFRAPSVRKFAISSEAMSRSRARLSPVEVVEDPLKMTSFVTGSRNSVSISSKASDYEKAFFGEEFEEPAPVKAHDDSVAISSFVTGSGKSVSISVEGLEKARAVFGEEFEETTSMKVLGHSVAATSFVTASGKSVSISSNALEKARAFFGEEFEETATVKALDHPVAVASFVTGSGKFVSISSKALVKARAFLGEDFEETVSETSHDRELGTGSHYAKPSIFTNESSPELNLHKPDAAGSLGAKLASTAEGEYQWRNGRAFKPPRIRKQSDDTVNSKGNISTSIFGANPCGNRLDSLNSVTLAKGHQQLKPRGPAYLKDGRSGWMRLQEYVEGTPAKNCEDLSPSSEVRSMTPDEADHYRIYHVTDDGRRESVGSTEIWKLLLELGADPLHSSQEWVANHCKWIIWKLTSSKRKHPRQAARQRLTLDTFLEELKYRYDTEISGRRSAIRRITEGDSSASRPMVLMVSAIRHYGGAFEEHTGNTSSSGDTAKIEVTDGWYRLNAVLDAPLTKYLRSGKLSVGQKIQVCGATLCCCTDSTSPLEAFRDSYFTLHVNGTYRARQNQRLGFCRGPIPPLAFRCIKADGGLVPKTYVGVARVYPILFKETSADGFSIVRSVRAEEVASNQFELRRAKVTEEAVLQLENSCDPSKSYEEKDDEGYELFDAVEQAAEPDVLMAEMTPLQLKSFAVYQAKREMSRQATMEDAVKEAVKDAGLLSRNVTRVLKVRVTGLQRRGEENFKVGQQRKEGMISIWDVGDEQDILEGSVYCVSGLRPVTWISSSNKNQLQLQAYRATSWRPVPAAVYETHFSFPYTCRVPTRLSDMDEKSVYREFDVAAKLLVVDEPFSSGSRTYQWVFMTDGSTTRNSPEDAWDEIQILAVKVSLPALAFAPVEPSLVGSVVGFCNLVQQPKDHNCHWWVAEASDLSFLSSNLASHPVKHLQTAANCIMEWDKSSPWAADSLRNLIQAMMSQGPQWYSF